MRLVQLTAPGRVEVNFMWLPTWLGINKEVKEALERELAPLVGREATDELLDGVNDKLLILIEKRFPQIQGLRDYLDGLKFVQL
jgi:hypothetical protein